MKDVLEFLEGIGNAITSLFEFIMDFFSDLLYVIEVVSTTVVSIPSYFSWLPTTAVAIVVTIFGVVVIYKILGREG